MPNQRAANKKCVAMWMDQSLKKRLDLAAACEGKNLTQYMLDLFAKHGPKISTPPTPKTTKPSAHAHQNKTIKKK